MGHKVRYNPKGTWQVVERARGGELEPVDQQEVWQQVRDDTYLKVTLERTRGFNSRVVVDSAQLVRGQQHNGKWRSVQSLHGHTIVLEEDETAQTSAPMAAEPSEGKTWIEGHLKDKYAVPERGRGGEERVK